MLLLPLVLVFYNFGKDLVINIYDTYYVMPYYYATVFLIFLWGLLGLGYWGVYKVKRRLSVVLSGFHILISFVFLGYLLFYLQLYGVDSSIYFNDFYIFDGAGQLISFFLFMVAQLVYVINVIRAFVIEKTQ
ncbi:hypothetical protein NBRC110019_25070 [Neptunitalea chrysea]|uniref:Uncharacterized protein n=2 Tax=Neptunitalea chrysea TaxID=1647581 RepID=A0A9W6EVW8_9FLAO|nr:hypothetical protein NBRC110019_25070 [Neptunitalea chrysea]